MKKLIYTLSIISSLLIIGCDNNTEGIGVNLIPDENIIKSTGTVFETEFHNFFVEEDSVYSNSTFAYLGKYSDDVFGYLETGYMTQLYCLDNFSFDHENMVTEKVDDGNGGEKEVYKDAACYISLDYNEFFGDSLNPCQVEVYKLSKSIDGNITSSVDPAEYYNEETDYLGKVTYTAANTYIDESERNDERSVRILLGDSIAQYIIKTNKEHPEYFKNAATFSDKIIKGLYLKPTTGDGTILYITDTRLYVNFRMYVTDSDGNRIKKKEEGHTEEDSTALYTTNFNSTREVYQVNTFENKIDPSKLNPERTYLKSPSAIFTKVDLPIGKIEHDIAGDTIMQVKLTLKAYNQIENDNEFNMSKPENVLMVKKKDVYQFFRENRLPDNKTSYLASLDQTSNTYTFNNISQIIVDAIAKKKSDNNGVINSSDIEEVIIVPVTVKTEESSSGTTTTSVRNNLMPQYVQLIKQENVLEVMHISMGDKQ